MDELLCERCTQPLNEADAVWLDLNGKTMQFRAEPWPADVSQGAFAFGKACAPKAIKYGYHHVKTPRSRQS